MSGGRRVARTKRPSSEIRPAEARKFLALIEESEKSCGEPSIHWVRGYLRGVLKLDDNGKPRTEAGP